MGLGVAALACPPMLRPHLIQGFSSAWGPGHSLGGRGSQELNGCSPCAVLRLWATELWEPSWSDPQGRAFTAGFCKMSRSLWGGPSAAQGLTPVGLLTDTRWAP